MTNNGERPTLTPGEVFALRVIVAGYLAKHPKAAFTHPTTDERVTVAELLQKLWWWPDP